VVTTTNSINIGTGTSGQVLTSNGAGVAPTFQAPSGGSFPWTTISGTSQSAAVNNGYVADDNSLVTVTLPGSFAVGDVIRIACHGSGRFKVTCAGGTFLVSSGEFYSSMEATERYNAIELIGIATGNWIVASSNGNFWGT
jgi:hypothetical protein